jgi:hypothetical protein
MSLKSPFTTQIERGGYSAIVYLDGDIYVAEDDVGTVIEESTVGGTSIQAAIDAQAAAGGRILIGYGSFTVTTPLLMKSYILLEGMGPYSSCISGKANMASVISFASGTQYTQAGIKNLRIDHDYAYAVTAVIDAYNLEYSTFDNLKIQGEGIGINMHILESGKTAYVNTLRDIFCSMDNAANECLLMTSTDNKIIGGTYFEGKGIQLGTGGNCNSMLGVHIAGSSTYGLYVCNNIGGRIIGCEIENNSGIGIFFYKSSIATQWSALTGNELYLNTTRDIHIDNCKGITITGNTCRSALASSITSINDSNYNIVVGNATEGAITLVGANNQVANNVEL